MRALFRIVASLVAGAMLTVVNVAPAAEVRRFMTNRQRVIYAFFMFGFGLIAVLTSSLVLLIDLVIQFERRGTPEWNGLLTALAVMLLGGIGVLIAARATLPRAKDFAIQLNALDLTASLTNLAKPIVDHWIQAGQNLANHAAAAQKESAAAHDRKASGVSRPQESPVNVPAESKDFLPNSGARAPELDFI